LRWKRSVEWGVEGAGISEGGAGATAPLVPSVRVASSTIASWSTEPAAAMTTAPGT
jgi:hypothetical protein